MKRFKKLLQTINQVLENLGEAAGYAMRN